MKSIIISTYIFFIIHGQVFALVSFSEIMYDAKGADTGYEWVEVLNSYAKDQDLSKYKFCDSGSCHGIYKKDGSSGTVIPGNSFAIISSKPEFFLERHTSFTGLLLKASFSLKNTDGEELIIKNQDGEITSKIFYIPESGGKDGKTLSLFEDTWFNSEPTPGKINQKVKENDDQGDDSTGIDIPETFFLIPESEEEKMEEDLEGKKYKLKAYIDQSPALVAGAESFISGRVFGTSGKEISRVEFFWNFGDGSARKKGREVSHIYNIPGEYIITFITKSGPFHDRDKRLIKVVAPNIEISELNLEEKYIAIKNNTKEIISLDGWQLVSNGDIFVFPKNTFLNKNSTLKISNKISGIYTEKDKRVYLKFPNQKTLNYFDWKEKTAEKVTQETGVKEKIASTRKLISRANADTIKKKTKVTSKKVREKQEANIASIYSGRAGIEQDSKSNQDFRIEELRSFSKKDILESNIYLMVFIVLIFILLATSIFLHKQKRVGQGREEEIEIEDVRQKALAYEIKELE